MQEPLDNLSDDARRVHQSLVEHPDVKTPEAIADGPYGDGLRPGTVADALRELQAGQRAVEAMGGWSVVG